MTRAASPPPTTVSEALSLLSTEVLRPMTGLLPKAAPPPTRKADMVAAIEGRLSGDFLRKLWERLDDTQRLAVSEALDTPRAVFDQHRFKAKYGKLPAGFGTTTVRAKASPLHFFLYAPQRHLTQPTLVPPDLAPRLRAFVPPPPPAEMAAVEEPPHGVELYTRPGDKQSLVRMELARRDMERTAQQDLLAVLRLIEGGRVAVSASTRRPSAAVCQRVAEVLAGGDFFDATARRAPAWLKEIGPIRAFAWPCLVQAAKLAELRGSKLALTKSGRAALHTPAADTLRAIWRRWLGTTLLDEFSRVDAIKGQTRGKGRRTMTAASGRRTVVADALAECPVGGWVRFDDFGRFRKVVITDRSGPGSVGPHGRTGMCRPQRSDCVRDRKEGRPPRRSIRHPIHDKACRSAQCRPSASAAPAPSESRSRGWQSAPARPCAATGAESR